MTASISDRALHLAQMQALPLGAKIEASARRIREWYQLHEGDVSVSYSGGKDSTVLSWLVDYAIPSNRIPRTFADTGLEYPEIREFALREPRIVVVRPKLSFLEVVQRYGYPVVSKRIAQYVGEVQRAKDKNNATVHLRMTGTRQSDGAPRPMGKISKKWQRLIDCGVPVNDRCCDFLKKGPMSHVPHLYIGVSAEDSDQRKQSYYREGCNSPSADRSWPMAFWLESDVWEFLRATGAPYSPIYDMGYTRTGCMFCMFGLHMEGRPHRFDRMRETHPQQYRWCMDGPLNLRRVITIVHGAAMLPSGEEPWVEPTAKEVEL